MNPSDGVGKSAVLLVVVISTAKQIVALEA